MAEHLPSDPAGQPARAESRPAVIIAALLYLIAAYQRTPCPCLAGCVVRHLDCLSQHAAADPVIRQICQAIRTTWTPVEPAPAAESGPRSWFRLH